LKKLLAISLLSIFLCANTELGQLLKLPTLLHHYLEHHEDKSDDENESSFANFLGKHYNQNNQHSEDTENDHQNLPFKIIEFNALNTAVTLAQEINFELNNSPTTSAIKIGTYTEPHYASKSFGSIWQPPKLG
jgi:hypothetical protein